MFLFLKKRKEENLKPLTEREIQEKLYGHLRSHVPKEEASTSSDENVPSIGELFTPPAVEPVKQVFAKPEAPKIEKRKKVELLKSLESLRSSFKQISFERFKLSLQRFKLPSLPALPRFSMPKIPRIRKPAWLHKLERVSLSMVAVVFFSVVLVVAVFRGVMQLFFKAKPTTRHVSVSRNVSASPNLDTEALAEQLSLSQQRVEPSAQGAKREKYYTIQLIVYEDATQSLHVLTNLKKKKLDVFLKPTKTSRGKDLYQVFLGHFKSYEEAQSALSKYHKKNALADFPDSFVRPQVE